MVFGLSSPAEARATIYPELILADFTRGPKSKNEASSGRLTRAGLGRNLSPVLIRLGIFLTLLVLVMPLLAQEEPVHMRPEFPLVFPLTTTGKNNTEVTVKYPVMINPTVVLKPGMVLRVLYILNSVNSDGSTDLVLAHHGALEDSYGRASNGESDPDTKKMPTEVAHEIEGYRKTAWDVPNNFVLAMAQYPTDLMHLIYSPTGKTQDLHDERFSFFDGLFVGSPSGTVTVIAVEKESKADAAGIKAGDEIVAVGGISTQNDLSTFASAYSTAKKVAMDNEVSSYTMTIRPGGKGDTRTAVVPLPPKIKGGLMDGFLDSDKPQKSDAPPKLPGM